MAKIRIKELREEKGISQSQLAKETNIDQRTTSNLRTLQNRARYEKIMDYFGVTAGYFLGFEEDS